MSRPSRSRAAPEYNYQRAYKACIPCRQRKVRCELDPARHQQPCKRCGKLDLECRFTTKQPWSRRKTESIRRNSRTTAQISSEQGQEDTCISRPLHSETSEGEQLYPEKESADGISTTVLQKKVTSGQDALDILFDAALQEREIPTPPTTIPDTASQVKEDDVLKIWERCRFVKGGWLAAHEAVFLMDTFFKNMAPASPIVTDFFASRNTHYWLITQEPMLCCTILMISARYHTIPGPFGISRGFIIHHRLWQHCQHLILRITLGQEKISKAKTRHLGTIEALLLLTEWYPRALHFPPETDGWDSDLMYTTPNDRDPPAVTEEMPIQECWEQDVIEPTRRSDRMSWMLVGSALALAHELGVFDSREQPSFPNGPDVGAYMKHLEFRRQRLPALLFVVSSLLASRIGCPPMMSDKYKPGNLDNILLVDPQWTNFMASWVYLTGFVRIIGEKFLLEARDNEHRGIDFESLEQFKDQLDTWNGNHRQTGNFHYDDILHIEYEYLRVFTNSLGVQGIVERVLSDTIPQKTIDETFISRARQINISRNEYDFIEEVIDGTCAILSRIVSLSQTKSLQYFPIRIFLRMVSSSVFLLKALSLGVRTSKLQESLHLLDQAIVALQSNQQDDIHLVSQYASLLQIHVSRLRQTFAKSGRLENQNGHSQEDAPDTDRIDQPFNEETPWDPSMIDWANQINHPGDWLSLPLDPLMAPFGSWDGVPTDLDSGYLDLDFIWNLPP